MTWTVQFEDTFDAEFDEFTNPVKTELLARTKMSAQFGPTLGGTAMGSTLQEKIGQLSPEQKAEVEARADELILEELSLRALRKSLKRTQAEVAEALGTGQDTVSRLENRCNIMVSTLDRYIKAIGGEVSIVAEFPGRPPVKLTFDELSKDLESGR